MRRILPRTLQYLSEHTSENDNPCFPLVEEWLAQNGAEGSEVTGSQPGNDQDTWHRILMDILDAKELSFAEVNRKRKKLTFNAFKDQSITMKCVAVESLVAPNVRCMYKLFQRSQAITALQRLPCSETEKRADLARQCFDVAFINIFLLCPWLTFRPVRYDMI